MEGSTEEMEKSVHLRQRVGPSRTYIARVRGSEAEVCLQDCDGWVAGAVDWRDVWCRHGHQQREGYERRLGDPVSPGVRSGRARRQGDCS